ncbi:hypothetical protein AUEXF2481DRAFT_152064 [Aureobasidium subglaciale EXF-2481]|uniref:Uncharacterized protein n=1 Tax=Aureobasidium subglaciale (strain EXF-2481) TaxID=1043005 RepID=A0A074YX17_AURSE|nr:uncharacterized protein AUEXF2481DRAFT_152064 [Aureobasidium subglaciale EXF-2481]KER00685.1 hypothetical protein AUEXF2481DRAFT_152064 [Aureobasidium subglaciale EXF-2481]
MSTFCSLRDLHASKATLRCYATSNTHPFSPFTLQNRSSLSSTFLSFSIAHLALLLVYEGEVDIHCTCLSPTSCSCGAVWHLRTTTSLSPCSTFEHVFKAHSIVHSLNNSRLSASSDAVGQVDLVVTTNVSIVTLRCQVIAAASRSYSNLPQ